MVKLLMDYGADMDASTPRGWTPLSYARAKGKYGPTEEQGIYPEVGHGWAGWRHGLSQAVQRVQTHLYAHQLVDAWQPPPSSALHVAALLGVTGPFLANRAGSVQERLSKATDSPGAAARSAAAGRLTGPWMQCSSTACTLSLRARLAHVPPPAPDPAVQDVLLYYGASTYGSGPEALGSRSPRNSYNPEADDFSRERGSYQNVFEHP